MVKVYINSGVKITSDVGMDLIRNYDSYRSKEISCPLSEEQYWSETTELPEEELPIE